MNSFPLLFIAALVVLMVVIAVLGIRADRKRTEDLRRAADQMGFGFDPADVRSFLVEGLRCWPYSARPRRRHDPLGVL